ncbi:hypothetical protein [Psychrobacillus antarcticus]|uniref:hypothetical protein n=1 Tax=Psychrobacillus antarcticus TaxID=2879115 RepID=UPI002407D488|nr:hypothetical protein [Psychrobacillus antarcticus]
MDFQELLKQLNKSIDSLDLVSARKYIEENIEVLTKNRQLLRGNSRAMFDLIKQKKDTGEKALSRHEINVIYSINSYATKFDLVGLKLVVNNNPELFINEGIKNYLNADAKTLLQGMNVLHKNPNA